MRHTLALTLPLLALAALSACNKSESTDTINDTVGDPMEKQLANAAPVELPPPLKSSKSYRCKDNSLVFVDIFADEMGANVRTKKDGEPTKLTTKEKGKPFEAPGGYKVEGTDSPLTVTLPGKPAQSCKA